ncbi:MAG: type 4a pilus biogenesis protein PilO [Deltaproteobacteria bacterium]|nr:type 4a pilus biogenesis protein PilO [Deltaproteobacteria bacterium]
MISNRFINIFRFNRIFWWIICFLLVFNLASYLTVIGHQRNKIDELRHQYNLKRKAKLPQMDDKQQRFVQAKEDIQFFKEQLSSRTDFSEVAVELFEILNRHGLSVDNTVYKPETADFQGLLKYTTSFTVNGKYPPLKAFLADIQESRTLFCIESLSFTNRSEGDESIDMKLNLATYFR